MITGRAKWILCINPRAGEELVKLARASSIQIELSPPRIPGIPLLLGPSDQKITGWVEIRTFLERNP